jgi:hypothetical protein
MIDKSHGFLTLSPDSQLGLSKSEEQTLRSEANGYLPLTGKAIIGVWLRCKSHNIDCEEGENDFETACLGVFTTSGSPFALRNVGLFCGIRLE